MTFLFIIYVALGYWASGETIYKNKVIIQTSGSAPLFMHKLAWGLFFGWALIPIAIIRTILGI